MGSLNGVYLFVHDPCFAARGWCVVWPNRFFHSYSRESFCFTEKNERTMQDDDDDLYGGLEEVPQLAS